jgi:hypothetical protein
MRSLLHTHIRKERERERERERVVLFVCSSQIITSWVSACFSFFLSFSSCVLSVVVSIFSHSLALSVVVALVPMGGVGLRGVG